MIIVSRYGGEYHQVKPKKHFAGRSIFNHLYPKNTSGVSYRNWDNKLLDNDQKVAFVLERSNQEQVSDIKHEDVKEIIMQCKDKQIIAWLIHPTAGMKFFLPEIHIINSLNGFFIIDHDKIGLEDNLKSSGSEPIQNYLNNYTYMGYPVLYTYNNYFRQDKCSRIFVPYAWFGKSRGGYKSLDKAIELSRRHDLKIVVPMWSGEDYDKLIEDCRSFWEEKECDNFRNIYNEFIYIHDSHWSNELSKCNLCVDLHPLYTIGKIAAECAAVGTYYIGTNRPFYARKIWSDANEDIEEVINSNYDRQKYYNRALKLDIQKTRQDIEEHFKCQEK